MEICTSEWDVFLCWKKELDQLKVKYKEHYDKDFKNLEIKTYYAYKGK